MPKYYEAKLIAEGKKFALVVSRFNDFITEKLLNGALDALIRSGASDSDLEVVRVPGAFEIPLVAKKMAQTDRFDAIICLGAVIRGSTPLESEIPVTFGILTTENIEQAIERAGSKSGNKGWEAAMAAVEMANLFDMID